eukprot:CAMPEP_0196710552 /NCGR_PEP_ID=MMETSP1090-20130531/70447_1 /TAXON_ID=37098 /ORGANISM="Isochrysis sp, Strain CCMP1244" /LENGTH=63 /DNA_ID=CAMNT_0042050585 /DNA_START=198 /DNA_END=386 /DNA_ORIENTATION=+
MPFARPPDSARAIRRAAQPPPHSGCEPGLLFPRLVGGRRALSPARGLSKVWLLVDVPRVGNLA